MAALAVVVAIPVALAAVRQRGPAGSHTLEKLAPVPLSLERSLRESVGAPSVSRRPHIVIEQLPPPQVQVALTNVNTDESATFAIDIEGGLRPDQARAVAHFFRCRRTGREMPIAPGTLALLADVAKTWPDHTIEVVSGFRAPPFGAPHSKHFHGHAIDLRVHGVKSTVVRDYVWRQHHDVGIGHYPEENFVHIDWRPGEPDMAWTASSEDGVNEYSPRWAWRARHPKRSIQQSSKHRRRETPLAAVANSRQTS